MKRKILAPSFLLLAAFFAMLTTRSAFGFIGGCVDSPEDPTAVMAMLGLGAAAVPIVWSRVRSRRKTK